MSIEFLPIPDLTSKDIWRFWSFTDFIGGQFYKDKCILWTGGLRDRKNKNSMRPVIRIGEDIYYASRISYFIYYKVDPGNLLVCHNCPGGDNQFCINPLHLFLGDSFDNQQDSFNKGREPSYGRTKLIKEIVLYIREQYKNDKSQSQLSKELNIPCSTIHNIVKRNTWKEI